MKIKNAFERRSSSVINLPNLSKPHVEIPLKPNKHKNKLSVATKIRVGKNYESGGIYKYKLTSNPNMNNIHGSTKN